MNHIITVTELSRTFTDIISRVYYRREVFEIKKGNNIVARLSPKDFQPALMISELNKFFSEAPRISSDTEDLENFIDDLKKVRQLQTKEIVDKWD